jgi:hypothetical protein
MSGKLILTITEGAKKGEIIIFEEHDTLLFGRHEDCRVCLPGDNYISRHHFILEVNPPDARIRDLGSRNGTHITSMLPALWQRSVRRGRTYPTRRLCLRSVPEAGPGPS